MNSKARLIADLRHILGDVKQIEAQFRGNGAQVLLRRVKRERAVVIPPLSLSVLPWETSAPKPQEQLLLAGKQGLQKLDRERDAADLSNTEILGLEAIVLLVVRPALFITGGSFISPSEPWGSLLEPRRETIRRISQSVGRIEVSFGFGQSTMIGTGFLVASDVVMTNRHVVQAFSELDHDSWRFMPCLDPAIDYSGERGSTCRADFRLMEVLAVHDVLDLALLRVSREAAHSHPTPGPLTLSSVAPESPVGRDIYVIGYPASDNQGLTPPRVLQDIFGSVYQVKRLQPGKMMDVNAARQIFTHDCSTLGGNSGSCVVDLQTGHVIGLHFQGNYRRANYAIALWQLVGDPLLNRVGVQFG